MKQWLVHLGVFALALTVASAAEARRGAKPLTLLQPEPDFEAIEHLIVAPPDPDVLYAKELAEIGDKSYRQRIAEPLPVGARMSELAGWETLADGSRRWRLRVSSWGAYFLAFELSDFELPRWGTLHFLSVERDYYDGPYTIRNNHPGRGFLSAIVPGDSAVLEVRIPAKAKVEPDFVLEAVSFGYKNFRNVLTVAHRDGSPLPEPRAWLPDKGLALKAECDIDANCPEGTPWQDEKRSVGQPFDGSFVCSGAVLNNVRQDCRWLFLTANHCFSKGKARNLVIFWNYENSGCGTNDAPIDRTTQGTTFLASNSQSDFFLVELNNPPPNDFFVHHTGWDASGAAPQSGTTIHHPNDLPKKISFEFDPLTNGEASGWGDDHWRVNGWDIGTTEPGSSGGVIWDQNQRVVGQLHGGTATCSGGWDEYGKVSASWNAGLSSHLDPDGTGTLALDDLDCNGGEPPPPGPPCELGAPGDPCTSNGECCSNKCKGKPGSKTCN